MSAKDETYKDSSTKTPPLIDVDCNLWHKDLRPLLTTSSDGDSNGDAGRLLHDDAIREANIVAMLSPSSTISEAEQGIQWLVEDKSSADHPRIRTTIGIHPYHVNDADCQPLDECMKRAEHLLSTTRQHIAAVGECGLDASDGFPPLEDQIPVFQAQIRLAERYKLPLFVHERLAHKETMELLQDVVSVPVIIHCFTGTVEECRAYMERGYYISFSGYICKNDVEETLACLSTPDLIPLDRIMIETDAPYLGFAGCRDLYIQKHEAAIEALSSKKRKKILSNTYPNLPSALPRVLQRLCEVMNKGRSGDNLLSVEEMAHVTRRNANRFFGFDLSDE